MHCLLVFRKMSSLIHFVFSPLASILFIQLLMKLQFITFKCILLNGRPHDVWYNSFSSINISHISCNFQFMVRNIMSDEFPFRQKTFFAFTALQVHGTPHNVWWISFSSKNVSHIYCTSSSWYSTWCFITFFVKNVYHILCMTQHMMFRHFF